MRDRLLKSRDVPRAAPQVAFNFADLDRQCEDYLKQVRQQADVMLQEAHEQSEAMKKESHASALEVGRREGLADAERMIEAQATQLAEQRIQQRLQSVVPALESAVTSLRNERDGWIAHWEQAAIRLSAAIAKRILKAQVQTRPDVTAGLISEALQLAAGSPRLTVRMHPEDAMQLEACGHPLLAQLSTLGKATVVPDSQVTRGGCLIETVHGSIDAQIETQIDRIVEELLN